MNITIIGAGKLGSKLAISLSAEDHDVTVIDSDSQKISNLIDKLDVQGICGRATHINALRDADVKSSDLVISATQSDENNILACMIAKKLGAKNTIARVRNPEYNSQFDFMRNDLGISLTVNPDFSAALEITRILQYPEAINIEAFANGYIDMAEFKVNSGSPLCENSISAISAKHSGNMIICAVERNGEIHIPNGDFIIKEKDKLYVTGVHKKLASIGKAISNTNKHNLKNIMIIGGSRVGIYLCDMLLALGKDVVIIDKDRSVCERMFDLVPKATIVNGDANDHDFLVEQDFDNMDAVLSLTDTDETNLLVSLYANRADIPKTIAKINNSSLESMLDDIGIDTVINVNDVSVSMITRYVRARDNISSSHMRTLYKLVGGKIEAIEFLAESYIKFLGVPISKLRIKKNVLIAAINRNNKIIFPGGNDCILENDLVVVVSAAARIKSLNDILS